MTHQDNPKNQSSATAGSESSSPLEDIGNQVEKLAAKTADSIRRVIDKALASRNTVLTIRVNDECNQKLNMLVEAGLFRSRSESAAFLIQEGIKSQRSLFDKIASKLKKIDQIREELKEIVNQEISSRDQK
ncbi:MAG: hypothetical protein DRI99_01395 [Candidatus Aminicenantes bacterium]|nr:hypothetical protein [Candidatus Aminicenantes bacterium]RLE04470.1 MAG: hypothetical protein DRJ11_00935 [Candidatus Aminicenantes bacterium]RLE05769.1 MAG: hypothetical protein DRI99_01395 [Candidatus Aminicenantes bacterium]